MRGLRHHDVASAHHHQLGARRVVFSTWNPIEEHAAIDFQDPRAGRQHPDIHNPHGLMLGDVGNYHVFECLSCPDRPYDHRWACS
jgi:hypothetical protein